MIQKYRLDKKGYINRKKSISFEFNGKKYFGYEGDTLASALLANGVHLIGRSFKYHRPRGFIGAGVDEPNAKVQLYKGAKTEPNALATEIELVEGLTAKRPQLGKEISDKEWDDFVYLRNNPRGKHSELWHHVAGCRQWFKASRDTATHEIYKTAKINEDL